LANKGAPFERLIAKQLSEWWTDGEDDSVFWRSQTSGARATSRAKKGLKTAGHVGDLCAVDERGRAFTLLITPELKRGYSKSATLSGPLDHDYARPLPRAAKDPRTIDQFIAQAEAASRRAGTPYWLVIHKRDKRQAVAYMPSTLFWWLKEVGAFRIRPLPLARLFYAAPGPRVMDVTAVQFDDFLAHVRPQHVKALLKKEKNRG
jgi:hypothetical protein